jgi:predicted RecB family nuclease
VSVPKLPKKPRLYLDIETDLQQSYTWLVGIVEEEGDEVRQFYAPHPSEEGEMLRELAVFLTPKADHSLVHFSGFNFDRSVLVRRMESHGIAPPLPLLQSIDCLPALRNSLALPTRGMGLKEAAECLGYRFAHPDLDGFMVAYEYQKAIGANRPAPERLLAYNRDDVLALRFLIQEVEKLAATPPRG